MNLTPFQENILQDAIDKWGKYSQIDMCIEECSELIQALCKYKRGREETTIIANIQEEIADVFITINQMALIFGKYGYSIQGFIDQKINRLEGRIKS